MPPLQPPFHRLHRRPRGGPVLVPDPMTGVAPSFLPGGGRA